MYVFVTEAHLAPMQTMGSARGLVVNEVDGALVLDTSACVVIGMDHRPLRGLIEAMDEQGPMLCEAEGWQIVTRERDLRPDRDPLDASYIAFVQDMLDVVAMEYQG